MHVYNAIIVMKEILPVFPLAVVLDTGASIDAAMDRFLETEERGDLKILGRAYVAYHVRYDSLSHTP
jgi:THO complex subunit 2